MNIALIACQLLAAAAGAAAPGTYTAAAAPAGETDFRVYVFAAYGAVLLLLLLFGLWSATQVSRAERKLERLEERVKAAGIDLAKERSGEKS